MYALAREAIAASVSLEETRDAPGHQRRATRSGAAAHRQAGPGAHRSPGHARIWLTGTGLTHLGSAEARDRMHAKAQAADASDSMKMFRMGLEGGKMQGEGPGVQPEWFYKGDGSRTGRARIAAALAALSPWTAARSRKSPASTSSAMTARRIGSVSPWPMNSPITSWNGRTTCIWRIRSCGRRQSVPSCCSASCRAASGGTARVSRHGAVLWEEAFPHGRRQHVASRAQSRVPPLQIPDVPAPRRCARPFLRHRDVVVRRRRQGAGRRCVRDRGRAVWPAAAQSVCARRRPRWCGSRVCSEHLGEYLP